VREIINYTREVHHVSFNPLYGSPVNDACDQLEPEGWELERIVPVSQYECVAVFTRHWRRSEL
jgi:hypothetical protein